MFDFASRLMTISTHAIYHAFGGILLLALLPHAHAGRPALPKVIRDAVVNGVKVEKTFAAASGLTGWILNEHGTYSVAYTTPDKRTLIIGTLINEKGENLTDRYAEKYFPRPNRATLFDQLGHSAYVIEGVAKAPKSVLYVFADPAQTNSYLLWKALQPYQRVGLQVRWIPVVPPGSTGMPKAVAMLDDTGTSVFLKEDVASGRLRAFAQSLSDSIDADADSVQKIRKNTALMDAFSINSVPGIVWLDRTGKVHVQSGMPRLTALATITGLPRQPITDPDLARFK